MKRAFFVLFVSYAIAQTNGPVKAKFPSSMRQLQAARDVVQKAIDKKDKDKLADRILEEKAITNFYMVCRTVLKQENLSPDVYTCHLAKAVVWKPQLPNETLTKILKDRIR